MDPLYGMMIIVVTSSPGGSYSNLMCSVMNADLALSIAMTTASSCLATCFLPVNLLLYSHLAFDNEDEQKAEIKWSEFTLSLGVVIAGIILGLYCSYKLEENIEIEVERRSTAARNSSVTSEDSELAHSFAKVAPSDEDKNGVNGTFVNAAAVNSRKGSKESVPSFHERTASMKNAGPRDEALSLNLYTASSSDVETGDSSISSSGVNIAVLRQSPHNRTSTVTMLSGEGGIPISPFELAKRFRSLAAGFGNICGVALIVFSLFVGQANAPIWNRESEFFAAVFSACGSGLIITFLITQCFSISHPERVAITIEACYQNVGIATSMALGMYEGDDQIKAVGIPLLYGFAECVLLGLFGVFSYYKNWTYANPKEVGFLKALLRMHQGTDPEEKAFDDYGNMYPDVMIG
eukprot:CAMPEP_0118635902 /NCGR_PEP_ID=MMETSP0785-20121206/2324_1 /TAXON_ID=91992 /ORGANISM="Bolidomonas pacifica, Strain CCMP 1866" /LENGTH=406 /DNA_ID=CAMNT_0006526967 /DNA_START=162 /DNA_END=1379 /DNA_ORIENTATION=-